MTASAINSLRGAVNARVDAFGEQTLKEMESAAANLVLWAHYLSSSKSREVCDSLLDGTIACVREAAACLAMGLVRPAIFAIRTQLELTLAWIYYNDHHIEWNGVREHPNNFKMRAEYLKYLRDNSPSFEDRRLFLEKVRVRKLADPYGVLSSHVHSTSDASTPKNQDLSGIVESDKRCSEGVELQREVAEYVSDALAAWFADSWMDFPEPIRTHIEGRLGEQGLKKFVA